LLSEYIARFLIGGIVVSSFAALGDVFRPKSFAGLFDAAPSVALATLALTVAKQGADYGAVEAGSMLCGAVAIIFYCRVVCVWVMRGKTSSLVASLGAMPVWFAVAFALVGVVAG